MSSPNYPHEWEELLAGYVLGDLTTEEVAQMQTIISANPELVTEIDRLQETLALLPLGLAKSYPPSNLRDRIAAVAINETGWLGDQVNKPSDQDIPDIAIDRRSQTTSNQRSLGKKFWKVAALSLGSLGTIISLSLGFDNYQMRQQIASSQIELQKHQQTIAMLQSADNRMISLKGMGAIPAASGSVMIAPSEKTAMISIQNLMPIPQDNSYRLWAIVDGKKIDCAKFRPDEQGKVFLKVPLENALKQSTTLIITIEPNQDMPEPTGEMVMKGEVSL